MNVICPKCQLSLPLDVKHLDEDTALVCRGCRSILKAKVVIEILSESNPHLSERTPLPNPPSPGKSAVSPSPMETVPNGDPLPDIGRKKVLIAVDGEGTKELIKEVLSRAGFEAIEASSGKEVIPLLYRHRPAVALIDVGLPEGLGSDYAAMIKKDPKLKGTIVILLASIYDKSGKYRQATNSLYGADDHIERQAIQSDLLIRIHKHLAGNKSEETTEETTPPPVKPPVESLLVAPPFSRPSEETSFNQLSKTQEPPLKEENKFDFKETTTLESTLAPSPAPPPSPDFDPDAKEKEEARRLARIIVSDIVLYNKKKVEEGLESGRFFELLKDEIQEGKKHYDSRISPEVQKKGNFYKEAFDDFIKKRKKVAP